MQSPQAEWYKEVAKDMHEMAKNLDSRIDATILTLAGGALVLSVGFLDKIITVAGLRYLWILGVSWFLLLLCLLFNFLTMILCLDAVGKHRKHLDTWAKGGGDRVVPDFSAHKNSIDFFQYGSFALLGLGLFCMTAFAFCNARIAAMADQFEKTANPLPPPLPVGDSSNPHPNTGIPGNGVSLN